MRTARGFSLIELVVTMIVAAILVAISLPYFADTESKATWFHEQVKAAVRYAQRQAVANRRNVYVFLTPQQVQLCYSDPCTPSSELTAYTLTAPSGVSISTTTSFSFNGLGRPSVGSTFAFTVGGKAVTVNAETGYVQ